MFVGSIEYAKDDNTFPIEDHVFSFGVFFLLNRIIILNIPFLILVYDHLDYFI